MYSWQAVPRSPAAIKICSGIPEFSNLFPNIAFNTLVTPRKGASKNSPIAIVLHVASSSRLLSLLTFFLLFLNSLWLHLAEL